MALDRPWTPTLRCVRCRRVALRDSVKAWLMQPVTPDGGPVHFECRRCRPPERPWRNTSRPGTQRR
jgi:hypothetical protein